MGLHPNNLQGNELPVTEPYQFCESIMMSFHTPKFYFHSTCKAGNML